MNNHLHFTGNLKSKEVHINSCYWILPMNEENKTAFQSLKEAIQKGYDTCGHCLPHVVTKAPTFVNKGYFCIRLEGLEYCNYGNYNIVGEIPRNTIKLYAKLFTCEDEEPVEGSPIKFTSFPNDVDEEMIATIKTDQNGIAVAEYDPINLMQGITKFRAYFPENTDFGDGSSQDYMDMLLDFSPSIKNVEVEPTKFKKSTIIKFDLLEDIELDISIYKNTNFQGPFSHRKTIRAISDGVLKKGNNIKMTWDGTNDRNRPTWKGSYVVALKTQKDFVFKEGLVKTTGKLSK